VEADKAFYNKWELCQTTNPDCVTTIESALTDADALIALSKPGPDVIKPDWIRRMAKKAIVFACANPVPEIYPYAAKEAGAYIVATGRGDFPNQVNNSMGFPGILKGSLLVRAKKITDEMAITSAYSLADYAMKQGINPDYIMPTMEEEDVFAQEAADVAMQAIKDGVARIHLDHKQVFDSTLKDIKETRQLLDLLMRENFIKQPDASLIETAVKKAVAAVS
jgi:malate dehydrogenase (oxaloacetate-decarboxylating)